MEKKKVSLTTFVLTLIIIALAIVASFIYIEKERIQDELNELKESSESKQTENIDDNVSTKIPKENDETRGKRFIQFNTDFYEIEEIAKESILYQEIEKQKEVNYDLDGDGVKDKITIESSTENNGEFILKLNGKECDKLYNGPCLYIVDLNENDKTLEVVIYDDGPSDDPNYKIYSKQNSSMKKINWVGGNSLMTDKKGTVVVEGFIKVNPQVFKEYYVVTDGNLETKKIDIEKYKDVEFSCEDLYFTTNLKNLEKYFEYSDLDHKERLEKANIQEMDKNVTFKILEFTDNYEIRVQLSNGTKGYIFSGIGHFAG